MIDDMSTYKAGQGAAITAYEQVSVCSYYDTQIMEKWIIQELHLLQA